MLDAYDELIINTQYRLGLLFLKHQQFSAAFIQFDHVLAMYSEHIGSLFHLGLLYLKQGELTAAEECFNHVIAIDKNHLQSLVNLGVIHLKREEAQLAIDYFARALSIDEHNIEARNNIAATFIHYDRFENALTHYKILLHKDPENIEYLYNAGVAQMSLGHLPEAIELFESVLKLNPNYFSALNNLAAINLRLNKPNEAIILLKQALKINPADKATQFMLQALVGKQDSVESCTPYVTHLFDNYAIHYDQHMQQLLKYNLPFQITRKLHELGVLSLINTLDLGCGTGLSGVSLRELSQNLTGVDISAKMLAQAKSKNIYDELIQADILDFLKHDQTIYDLIVAAEVLPYFGDLQQFFMEIKARLKPQGLFIFSSEIGTDVDWSLQKTMRFCHNVKYIHSLCTELGFSILSEEKIVTRQQEEHDFCEMLYVLTPSRSSD